MAFINERLYLAGDNMGYILVLDTAFAVTDTIVIIADAPPGPIPKATKPDIEAAVAIRDEGVDALLLIGSGSHSPYRDNGWIVNTTNSQVIQISLGPFYDRLRAMGLEDLNIEGATSIPGFLVLSNRGNQSARQSQLVFTSPSFWNEQEEAGISIKKTGVDNNTGAFSGVSGMEYSALSDQLLLTVSTEDTPNSYADGAIGKSYLWMVNNISAKISTDNIIPNRIIDLEAADSRFHGQKIEAVCIVSETPSEMKLALVADNDTRDTVLFLVSLVR